MIRPTPGSFTGELKRAVARHRPEHVVVTEPGEWRVLEMMQDWREEIGVPVHIRPDARFIASREDFARWAEGRKSFRMEFFYREMRRATGLLMQGDEPRAGSGTTTTTTASGFRPACRAAAPTFRARCDHARGAGGWSIESRFPTNFGDLEPFGGGGDAGRCAGRAR